MPIRSFLRRLIGPPPPSAKRAPTTQPARSARRGSAAEPQAFNGYFEALRPSSDRTPMHAGMLQYHARGGASGLDRTQLSALSRALYENGGFVGYAVNQIAIYSAPILPQAASDDDAWNTAAETRFMDWAKRADFLGRPEMDLWSLQIQVSQALDLDGDIGVSLTSESGFPQVQLIEGWRIGSAFTGDEANVIDGVKLDAKGRVVGYMVLAGDAGTLISSTEMMLVRDPCIVNPFRGLSPLRRGMNDIRDARDILGFEKVAMKANSALLGVIEGDYMDDQNGLSLSGSTPPSQVDPPVEGEVATPGEESLSRADLLAGDVPVLPAGRKFNRVESNRPSAGFSDFMDSLVAQFAAGLDIPPAFFLDQKLTGPNQRSVNAKAQRKFDQRQTVICRMMEWLWVRVIASEIQTGGLPAVDGWWQVQFQRPARMTIDSGREAQQDREDQLQGLLTRQDHFGCRGKDWQRETDQCFAEDAYIIERAAELAAKTGIPLPTILCRYGFEPPKVPATPPGSDPASAPAEPAS